MWIDTFGILMVWPSEMLQSMVGCEDHAQWRYVQQDYFNGNDAEKAVLGMHGRSLFGGHHIEVELTEVYLTTNRNACHAGTDIFRRPEVKGFLDLLGRRAENFQMLHLMPIMPNQEEEETAI